MLVTSVTLSIPLWRRIRNSGDDPTTIFRDSPVHSLLCFSSLSSLVSLPFSLLLSLSLALFLFLSLSRRFPLPWFFCSSSLTTSLFVQRHGCITHTFQPSASTILHGPSPQPPPSRPSCSRETFPRSIFLRIYTCWTSLVLLLSLSFFFLLLSYFNERTRVCILLSSSFKKSFFVRFLFHFIYF